MRTLWLPPQPRSDVDVVRLPSRPRRPPTSNVESAETRIGVWRKINATVGSLALLGRTSTSLARPVPPLCRCPSRLGRCRWCKNCSMRTRRPQSRSVLPDHVPDPPSTFPPCIRRRLHRLPLTQALSQQRQQPAHQAGRRSSQNTLSITSTLLAETTRDALDLTVVDDKGRNPLLQACAARRLSERFGGALACSSLPRSIRAALLFAPVMEI